MSTLRDEYRKRRDEIMCFHSTSDARMYAEGAEAALAEYGSYRIVEGVLEEAHWYRGPHEGRLVVLHTTGEEPSYILLGPMGDNVKLLLPPEKKEDESLNRRLLAAQSDKRDAQHKADKYEKALREIDRVWKSVQWPSLSRVKRIAREALDEHDGA